jgi:hypothetical protein
MGTGYVKEITRSAAEKERDELLRKLGLTMEEAQAKADNYSFTLNEISVWHRIKDLTWLLDG